MAVPTDAVIATWKRGRTRAANNFQLAVDGVDPLVNGNLGLTIETLEQMLTEIEVKFSSYEKAHDKIVGGATNEQLARDDCGNLMAVEHEALTKKREDSEQALKVKKRAMERAADDADRAALRDQQDQQARLARDARIASLRNTLASLRLQQDQGYVTLDAEAEHAEAYADLCAIHVGFAGLRSRLKQIEECTRELTGLDHTLYESLDAEYQTASLRMGQEICRIQNKIRQAVLANEHRDALLALYPDLRPVTPPSTPQREQPHEGAPGVVATDWDKVASAISKGISGVGSKVLSVKKQDPPKFSGKISDYPRWRKNWKEIMKENRLSDTIQLRYAAEAMPAKDVSVRSRIGNCKTMEEAWVVLEGEYGDPQDLLRDRLAKLSGYQPPKNTKSALTKFKDLMSTWREVRADLKEVALLHKMDHDITFYDFIKNLGRDSVQRWVAYEAAQPISTTQTRSFIFDSWLDIEVRTLKSLDYTDPHSDVGRTKEDKGDNKDQATGACFGCGEVGHRRSACTKVDKDTKCNDCGATGHTAKACRRSKKGKFATNAGTASGGPTTAKCPKCAEEHLWRTFKGEERVSTRFGNCPKFVEESVDDRAKSVEAAKGCVRCLDYSGLHKHGECRYQGKCGVCQRTHNTMLHGTNVPYVDCCN